MQRRIFAPAAAGSAVVLATALLGGCSTDVAPPSEETIGDGVPFGATLQEYQTAFSDMDPVVLKYQFTAGQDSEVNAPYEDYLSAVEEWSDGKVTFDRAYGASLVPNSAEWAAGLSDGRLDLTYFIPYLTPGVFPRLSELAAGTFLDANTPTATLASTAAFTDAIYSDAALQEEADAAGVHLLMRPPNFSVTGYFCPEPSTSLDDFSGKLISIAGESQHAQVSALGATPQSVAFTEIYEALERGVVDCIATSVTTIQTFGATELVPNMSIDPASGLSDFLGFYGIGKEIWDSLPLVAQQVLYDRLDVLVETLPRTDGVRMSTWLNDVEALDGGVTPFDTDAEEALSAANEELLAGMNDAGLDTERLIAVRDEWQTILTDELYPELPESISDFLREGGYSDDVDLSLFSTALYEQLLSEYRPG